jgi:hypothetical protein
MFDDRQMQELRGTINTRLRLYGPYNASEARDRMCCMCTSILLCMQPFDKMGTTCPLLY